jgi:RimJ/RimL family protein N-acetyltransferase
MRMYKCLNKQEFSSGDFKLVPIREEDIESIRIWRNEQTKILRQSHIITQEQQIAYFEKNIWKTFDEIRPTQILFSYLKDDVLIGYGALVHINWLDKRGEISFLLATEHSNDIERHCFYFEKYLSLIQQVGFNDLNFHRLHAEVYDTRKYHTDMLSKCGFVLEGRLKEHIFIENQYVDSLYFGKLKKDF